MQRPKTPSDPKVQTLAIQHAIAKLSQDGSLQARGAVFTQKAVVGALLDHCGYRVDQDLTAKRALEPACGEGDFFIEMVRRLLASARRVGLSVADYKQHLALSLLGVEIHAASAKVTQQCCSRLLEADGMNPIDARWLAQTWIRVDDFLTTPLERGFDVVVGNPPYVRQERIPKVLLAEYRRRYTTLYDRADLYVMFYERGLDLLNPQGTLGFICANRWVKNKYGRLLRDKVAKRFHLDLYVDLAKSDAFARKVDAYPCITVIRNAPPSRTGVISARAFVAKDRCASKVQRVSQLAQGGDPWLLDAPHMVPVLRMLESRFPTLERAGAKVGIGVATGADRVYVRDQRDLQAWGIESSQQLKLAMAQDLALDGVQWGGKVLVNPWRGPSLADLSEFPKLGAYLMAHKAQLASRHVAKRSPQHWYRTIDRVHAQLLGQPKLLIPDIKGSARVVFDPGGYYPHHNLYVITALGWDLRVLQALLRSSVALSFVAAYSVRMAGGYLRFQAQYLRRIRVPAWESLSPALRESLAHLSAGTDQRQLDELVLGAYGLTQPAAGVICRFADQARRGPRGF